MTLSQVIHDSTSFILPLPPVDIATLLNLLYWDKKTQRHFLAGAGVFVLFSEKRSQPNEEKSERSFMASDCLSTELVPEREAVRAKTKLSVSSLDWDPALSVGGPGSHWKAPCVLQSLTFTAPGVGRYLLLQAGPLLNQECQQVGTGATEYYADNYLLMQSIY